jgi:hypothetical protein
MSGLMFFSIYVFIGFIFFIFSKIRESSSNEEKGDEIIEAIMWPWILVAFILHLLQERQDKFDKQNDNKK